MATGPSFPNPSPATVTWHYSQKSKYYVGLAWGGMRNKNTLSTDLVLCRQVLHTAHTSPLHSTQQTPSPWGGEQLLYLPHVFRAACLPKFEKGHLSCLKDVSDFWIIFICFKHHFLITTITTYWNKFAFSLLPCTVCLHISMDLGQDSHEVNVCKRHSSQQEFLVCKEVATYILPFNQLPLISCRKHSNLCA